MDTEGVTTTMVDSAPAMIPYTMMNTGYHPSSSTELLDSEVANIGHDGGQESEPNDFKLDLGDDDKPSKSAPAIILMEPSPVSFQHVSSPVSSSAEDILSTDGHLRPMSPGSLSTDGHLRPMSPASIHDDKVGFYIGDSESLSSQKNTPKRKFYVGDDTSLSTKKSEISLESSTAGDSESIASKPQESNWLDMLSDEGNEPLLSMSASHEGSRNSAGDFTRVKFSMGKDIIYDICMYVTAVCYEELPPPHFKKMHSN